MPKSWIRLYRTEGGRYLIFSPIFTKKIESFFKKRDKLVKKLHFVGNKTGILGHVLKHSKERYPYYPKYKKKLIKICKFHYLPQLGGYTGESIVACVGGGTCPCHGKRNELHATSCYSYTYDTQKLHARCQHG
jgi:hypothetical protein